MKTCVKEGCLREVLARNLCSRHYQWFMTNEATDRPECAVKNCNKNSRANGLCVKHYNRLRDKGDVAAFSCQDPNRYINNADGTHTIILTDKKGNIIGESIIDSDQLEKVSCYKWYLNSRGYVQTNANKTIKFLHQIIFPVPDGYITDHIDRDKLNNRFSNLRKCNCRENRINCSVPGNNKSGFIGVGYDKKSRKWEAGIGNNYHRVYLGRFHSKEEAIFVRLHAEKKYYGEFAPQKYLFKRYGITGE